MSKETSHKDRISKYLIELNKNVLFDELSEDYLRRAGVYDVLNGVPVPVMVGLGGDELSTLTIGLAMARIVGADNNFVYRERYMTYIDRVFGEEFTKVIISEGAKAGGSGDYEVAAMLFRAALLKDPYNLNALYLYGRACKDAYETENEDEEYVGNFKAESIDAFETLTMMHPDFAMGYYFLGYGYANLGLYKKAELTWKEFMKLSESSDDDYGDMREEIGERLEQLAAPVRIEGACNSIMGGDFIGGLEVLNEYREGDFAGWWPLWYHIGVAEEGLAHPDEALDAFKRVLRLNPSNVQVMAEIVDICIATGRDEEAEKYKKKIDIVLANVQAEQEEELRNRHDI